MPGDRAVAHTPERLALVHDLGELTVDAATVDVAAAVRQWTGSAGADVVFELMGTRGISAAALWALGEPVGRVVLIP